MLVSALIDAAMRKIGVTASGETPSAAERQDGLESLQLMLRSWAAEKINVFASVHETVSLVSGTSLYIWGVGGTINTARPNQVVGASITDSDNTTFSVEVISEGTYRQLSNKTVTGRPYSLLARFEYPYVQVYLYPVPDTADTLNLDSIKPFTETSSFSAVSDELDMPLNYEEPIVYNLAIRLAPEYGKSISSAVAAMASESYRRLITLNAGNYVEPVRLVFPAGSRSSYSINSDSYR